MVVGRVVMVGKREGARWQHHCHWWWWWWWLLDDMWHIDLQRFVITPVATVHREKRLPI